MFTVFVSIEKQQAPSYGTSDINALRITFATVARGSFVGFVKHWVLVICLFIQWSHFYLRTDRIHYCCWLFQKWIVFSRWSLSLQWTLVWRTLVCSKICNIVATQSWICLSCHCYNNHFASITNNTTIIGLSNTYLFKYGFYKI